MRQLLERLCLIVCAICLNLLTLAACGSDGDGDGGTPSGPPPPLEASRTHRAIAGVSMGGYGAMNLGTKYPDLFAVIASLGGPVDMQELLRHALDDNLEVKAQTEIPRQVGADFTYDHMPPYPDRDTRLVMFQDLAIAFGNPFLHHPDPAAQYLAIDAEAALIGEDDRFGVFTPPDEPRGFRDGGDANDDGLRQAAEEPELFADVALLARGSLPMIVSGATPVEVGGRLLADLDGNGIYDVGEGVVVNDAEPFTDTNGDRVYQPEQGETFTDSGLDGVPGTGDFGEGNGMFDYDPDRAGWLAEDPLTRLAGRGADEIARQSIYMDVGLQDEFEFAQHYENFVAMLEAQGLTVATRDGFDGNCTDLPNLTADYLLVRYDAGHIGVDSVDPDDLLDGDFCGQDTVWQRIISMLGYLEEHFPDGVYGPGGDIDIDDIDDLFDIDPDIRGDLRTARIDSPALARDDDEGTLPRREALVYLPPRFDRTDDTFPVVYFLGGYGQEPEDFEPVAFLFDALILSGQMQNMFFVFLPGDGGRQGSFYVNHVIPHEQVPELMAPTSGRYEDSIIRDLIPAIEDRVLRRRVRQEG